ncbi:MAG TPA: ABC transporter permease [Bryobacteraceae bacterium]|nr:ABC transporter permease [Bryobacteraceae bacterium]
MIAAIVRNGFRALRRDRGALILSFILPIAFFTIFGVIFGGMHDTTPRVRLLVVDEDRSEASGRLVRGLLREPSLNGSTRPEARKGEPAPPEYTAATAETAVQQGDAPAALIIPRGFGASPMAFAPGGERKALRILHDSSDPVAAQVVAGMAQKVVMTSMPDTMADLGMKYFAQASGGLTPEQRKSVESGLSQLRGQMRERDQAGGAPAAAAGSGDNGGGLVAIEVRDVVGEKKRSPMVAFYAAGIGVMFLMFTASAAGGSLLDEAESGALDRILSGRVSMTTLLAGKMAYCTLLACAQLTLMFLWAAAVFHLDLFTHLPGFFVMTVATAFAVASFGMLLASLANTRAQLGAISTLIILTMSAIGGSMFPRFLMPEGMKKVGLMTFNAWAIDGYTKVFWRDEPVSHLGPQVAVLIGAGMVLFLLARRFARRWEYA